MRLKKNYAKDYKTLERKMCNMNEINIFKNEEFGEVRTTIINEEVYFVGRDVARALGYNDLSQAIRQHIPDKDKIKLTGCQFNVTENVNNNGLIVINEAGLYKLVFRSKLPSAERFSDWVCSEVLPSIRKHGVYATETTIEKIVNDPDYFIGLLTNLKQEQEKRKEAELIAEQRRREAAYKQKIIEEQKPKIEFYNFAIDKESTYTTTEIAKSLGFKTAHQLNLLLKEKGIVYRQGSKWPLTAKYSEQGYQRIRAYANCEHGTLVWTLKGFEFLKKLLTSRE